MKPTLLLVQVLTTLKCDCQKNSSLEIKFPYLIGHKISTNSDVSLPYSKKSEDGFLRQAIEV